MKPSHIGCYHQGPSVRVLYTVAEVILALGDTDLVAKACGTNRVAVRQWRKKNRIPHEYEHRIRDLLGSRRYAAPPLMFTAPGHWERFQESRHNPGSSPGQVEKTSGL